MKTPVEDFVEKYHDFGGEVTAAEIQQLWRESFVVHATTAREKAIVAHIRGQLKHAWITAEREPKKRICVVIDPEALHEFIAEWDEDNPSLGKHTDRGRFPSDGRVDNYWQHRNMHVQFTTDNKSVRIGKPLPAGFKEIDNEIFLEDIFELRGVEYGNWLSQQDRVNYLAGAGLAFFDLAQVLGFKLEQIGFYGLLSIAFGARGRGAHAAHFEPARFVINLTRFHRPPSVQRRRENYSRAKMIFDSGGIGALCHEYGHALDTYGGFKVMNIRTKMLSDGRSLRTSPDTKLMKQKTLYGMMEKLMYRIIWSADGKRLSNYYQRIQRSSGGENYWLRRCEIFARVFEVYIFYKMKKKKWFNLFLHDPKYETLFYPTIEELKTYEKDFDELIVEFRRKIIASRGSKH